MRRRPPLPANTELRLEVRRFRSSPDNLRSDADFLRGLSVRHAQPIQPRREIRHQIPRTFAARRQPNQRVGQAESARVSAGIDACVILHGRQTSERTPPRLSPSAKYRKRRDERDGLLDRAVQLERHHAAKAGHLLLRDLVARDASARPGKYTR